MDGCHRVIEQELQAYFLLFFYMYTALNSWSGGWEFKKNPNIRSGTRGQIRDPLRTIIYSDFKALSKS